MLELPFWLILLSWSFLPSTQTSLFTIESIPISLKDLLIIPIAGFYFLLQVKNKHPINTRLKHWHHYLPLFTVVLLIYAATSIQWSGMDKSNCMAMLYTLVLTGSACLLAYYLIAKIKFTSLHSFLWRLTIFVALVGLLYTAQSFFSLGWTTLNDSQGNDFGIQRVRGPLFGSTTGYFMLVPALGFAIDEILQNPSKRLLKLSIVFSLLLTIISLGSRSAFILLSVLLTCLVLFIKNRKYAVISLAIVLIVTTSTMLLFYSRAKTDRLQSLEDTSRQDTYLTSFQIIENRSELTNIFGSGYGSYWPWYIPDTQNPRETGQYFDLVWNPYGSLLYHPHSTFLLCIVELGLPGLIYFAFIWFILVKLLFENFRGARYPIFFCAIFTSGFSMFFDFFLFKATTVSTLWWMFLFGALCLNYGVSASQRQHKIISYQR
ncbi:O-antigen ligase family protein [Nostoc sp. CENA67]|uniref:O-antigen ligase family protein n=1 Tax=Amazonocrinis nigriterrae CENA67 TaxID=2794033 RepID=A0A8J7L7J6_9NOST|nr:O-antigen ligase family protein [Amazonocrinis nigriterrae]MBH8562373.1 O-antigen ligase family protein [Amazonocrinis nigriterrae CENA67]MBH8562406.1 O-antigen ligase family protein [Amazonocrinis nigriterrae CENA67]